MAANGLNGSTHHRPLKAGIYAPIPSFFLAPSEDLDIPALEDHIVRLAAAGVWPLLAGSMGEGIHLSHSERIRLIHATRKALDGAGHTQVPIIVGTGAGSLRETIEINNEVAAAGADYAIVICSGYFAGVLAPHREALATFFSEAIAKSPIPVIIYNYPLASGGIDLDSDLVCQLARDCPNACGVKLTCGNVGKLTRIADFIASPEFTSKYPRKNADAPFLILGGYADFITPSAFVTGHGAITGLANVAPFTLKRLYQLTEDSTKDLTVLAEAQKLQGIVARADYTIAKTSIAGTKFLLQKLYGYGGVPRRPLPPIDATAGEALWAHPHVQELVKVERELGGKLR